MAGHAQVTAGCLGHETKGCGGRNGSAASPTPGNPYGNRVPRGGASPLVRIRRESRMPSLRLVRPIPSTPRHQRSHSSHDRCSGRSAEQRRGCPWYRRQKRVRAPGEISLTGHRSGCDAHPARTPMFSLTLAVYRHATGLPFHHIYALNNHNVNYPSLRLTGAGNATRAFPSGSSQAAEAILGRFRK